MTDEAETLAPENAGNPAANDDVTTNTAPEPTDAPAPSAEPVEKEVKPDWPDDWRDKMAGGDPKALKQLQRFQSPLDVQKAYRAAQQKISSGEFKATLPDDATEEQIAAYREQNGIPDKPEGYLEKLPDGLVIGENDKELFGSFAARLHSKNADPAVVSEALGWYHDLQEKALADQAETDKATRQQYEDELRAEWGSEYRSNVNAIKAFMDTAPTASDGTTLKELVDGARLSDGTPIGTHPTMLRWLSEMATAQNPAGVIAPGSGTTQIDAVDDEIKSIEKVMRTDRRTYNKDQAMQKRYVDLLAARDKLRA